MDETKVSKQEMILATHLAIAQEIPRDILSEIFLQCLPTNPLDVMQPDITQSPMLLCQICSYWRSVALVTPKIWEQLYHVSFIARSRSPAIDILREGIRPMDVQFLRWWRKNVGPKGPILRLRLDWSKATRRGETLDEDLGPFFTSLLSSAQYLDLDSSYIIILQSWVRKTPLVYPKLRELVLRYNKDSSNNMKTHPSNHFQMIPIEMTHTLSLRRLYVEHLYFSQRRPVESFLPWSQLTHARMIDIKIPARMWFQLIRKFSDLQIGQFYIDMMDNDETDNIQNAPPKAVLPKLRQLHLTLEANRPHAQRVFENLQFPRLAAFRLNAKAVSLDELHRMLASAPAITELQLCGRIPFNWEIGSVQFPPSEAIADPLWKYVPTLEYLFLDGSCVINRNLAHWLEGVLQSGWLQLGTGTNCINRLELSLANPSDIPDILALYQGMAFGILGWMDNDIFSIDRSDCTVNELKRLIGRARLPGVEVVLRDLEAPKLWSGKLLKNDQLDPNFDLGFYNIDFGSV